MDALDDLHKATETLAELLDTTNPGADRYETARIRRGWSLPSGNARSLMCCCRLLAGRFGRVGPRIQAIHTAILVAWFLPVDQFRRLEAS